MKIHWVDKWPSKVIDCGYNSQDVRGYEELVGGWVVGRGGEWINWVHCKPHKQKSASNLEYLLWATVT